MSQSLAPFSSSYTSNVPDILAQLDCSLVFTTYQAGKVILLSPDGDRLVQLARNFKKPMGMAVDGGRLAVATHYEIVVLENAPSLASGYPKKPDHYDALFVPRGTLFTGQIDLHDMAWSGETLWGVNTLFSCLCTFDLRHSFEPHWTPPFISELQPEDRCHLNGLAMQDGAPRYVTALGTTDHRKGWRETRQTGGVLMDVESSEIVLDGLPMPHSPRLFGDDLYLVTSADGALLKVDAERGTADEVNRVPGFARGLAKYGDYLFVAHSRIREKHVFADLPIAQEEHYPGIVMIHEPSGRIAGAIRYHTSCEEIYDVHVLPGIRRPGILGVMQDIYQRALVAPNGGYWARKRGSSPSRQASTE